MAKRLIPRQSSKLLPKDDAILMWNTYFRLSIQ